jgi:poly(beta-D-mannuronate) lyase
LKKVEPLTNNFFCSFVLSLVLLSAVLLSCSIAEEHRVTPQADLSEVCEKLVAGDSIVLANGTWADAELDFLGLKGTPESPITITAETAGGVVLTGKSEFRVAGNHVAVSGLVFRDCVNVDNVLELRAKVDGALQQCHHCRVTECSFEQSAEVETEKETTWLAVYGANNRVDHCYFGGKQTRGATIVIWVGEESEKHRLDHNHFGPRPELGQNGGETIRIGSSKDSEFACRTTVENNYFHQCDGEAELISNKSCENVYRHNVFDECRGTLTLRHGHRCVVDGNVFLGNETSRTGGVRIIGQGHRVTNNYFEGLRGDKERAAISLMNGIPDGPLNGYAPIKNALVAHNTLIDCKVSMEFGVGAGKKQSVAPADCRFINNVFSPGKWGLYRVHAEPVGFVWQGNKLQVGREYELDLVKVDRVALRLKRAEDGLMRPTELSELQSETSVAEEVKYDIDGQARGESVIAGCDEPGTSLGELASPSDTGPKWRRDAAE